jgi:hypothetical protein
MAHRQLPPRYTVRYAAIVLSQPALPCVGDERTGVHAPGLAVVHEREATTLAGARSIQRALQRRGHRVQGIYERINLRVRPSWHGQPAAYTQQACGRLEGDWDWDSERPVEA